jgi:hypothetical protein
MTTSKLKLTPKTTSSPSPLPDREIHHRIERSKSEWAKHAIKGVITTARLRPQFSTDDVWYSLTKAPEEPRTMGVIMLWAQKLGIIEPLSEWHPTLRASAHRRPVRIWRSKIYECSP